MPDRVFDIVPDAGRFEARSRAAFATERRSRGPSDGSGGFRQAWETPSSARPRASPGCRPGAGQIWSMTCAYAGSPAGSWPHRPRRDGPGRAPAAGPQPRRAVPVAGRHAAAGHGPGGARDGAVRQRRGLPPGLPAGDEPAPRRDAGPRRGTWASGLRPSEATCAPGPWWIAWRPRPAIGRTGAGAELRGRDSSEDDCGPARSPSTSRSTSRPAARPIARRAGSAAASDGRGPPGAPSPAISPSTAPPCPTTRRCSTRSCGTTTGRCTTGTTSCFALASRGCGLRARPSRVATMSTHTRPADWQGLDGPAYQEQEGRVPRSPARGPGKALPGSGRGTWSMPSSPPRAASGATPGGRRGPSGGPPCTVDQQLPGGRVGRPRPGALGRRRFGLPRPGDHGRGDLGHPRRRADHRRPWPSIKHTRAGGLPHAVERPARSASLQPQP